MTQPTGSLPEDEEVALDTHPHWISLAGSAGSLVALLLLWTVLPILVWAWLRAGSGPAQLALWLVFVTPLALAIIGYAWYRYGEGDDGCLALLLWLVLLATVGIAGLLLVAAVSDLHETADSPWMVLWIWLPAGMATFPLLFLALRGFLRWRFTRYVVTDQRLIRRTGVIRRSSQDLPLRTIQDVHLHQGLIARLAGSGTLELESGGRSSAIRLAHMPQPEDARQTIRRLAAPGTDAAPDPPDA